MLAVTIIIILLLITFVWLAGVFVTNDFSLPNASISKYKNVLIIFPHADDEVLTTGGLIGALKDQGSHVTLVVLTKGEKGTPTGELKLSLKETRTAEVQSVSKILGVSNLTQEDFGDGDLVNKRDEITQYLSELITQKKPDLILTYDQAGLYGHPDHIVVAEIITDLVNRQFNKTDLWYVTYPQRVLSMMHLPEHMANNPNYKDKRKAPNIKFFIVPYSTNKLRAVYEYKSQEQSFKSAVPVRQVPLWFWHSMPLYEYFYTVN